MRERGKPGADRTRGLVCKGRKHTSSKPQVQPDQSGFPRAMVLTVSSALSPVTGLFCHRRLRIIIRRLDASVGASGPHGFAVRISTVRLAALTRPSHPALNVRDDRDTPLL